MPRAPRNAAWLLLALLACGGQADDAPRPSEGTGFSRLGAPFGAPATVSDLVSDAGRLYGVASRQPLSGGEALLFVTDDGHRYKPLLPAGASEGLLRIRPVGDRLWVPDADPAGRDAGLAFSLAGDGVPREHRLADALHTYDVVPFGDELLTSNGMRGGYGALLARRAPDDWTEVATARSTRLKWLVAFRGGLFAAIRPDDSGTDYVRWREAPARGAADPVDAVPGGGVTFRWYVSSRGRLYWSHLETGGFRVRATTDGEHWTDVPSLAGRFVSDFAELNGRLYALSDAGLHRTLDHDRFELVAPAPDPTTFAPVPVGPARANSDASASLAAHEGALWCGSSRDGHLYRIVPSEPD